MAITFIHAICDKPDGCLLYGLRDKPGEMRDGIKRHTEA